VPSTAHDDDKLGQLTGDAGVVRNAFEQLPVVRAADAERRNPGDRGIVAELQAALLPTALPVLPRVMIAARYLVAGQEQAAGGDWFDAIPLDSGGVALVVGDVVGHGVAASAAMGQLRAVLAELLAAEKDLGHVLRRTDAFAARMPSLRAATLALTTARDAFAGWLSRLGATAEDAEALHLAMVEVFTNAIEHAYPRDETGTIELDATLEGDGSVTCLVTDHGTWQPPDPADEDRGHGLMVAGHVVDKLLVSHPRSNGTTVTLRHRLRRPAILASGHGGVHAARPGEPRSWRCPAGS